MKKIILALALVLAFLLARRADNLPAAHVWRGGSAAVALVAGGRAALVAEREEYEKQTAGLRVKERDKTDEREKLSGETARLAERTMTKVRKKVGLAPLQL